MIQLPIYNNILVLLINIIGIWLGFLVYQNNPKKKLNKIFVFMVVLMLFWVNFAYFARLVGREQVYLSLLFLKIAWFVTPLFFTLLYLLAIHLLEKEKEYQFLTKIVLFGGIVLALVTSFTNLSIEGVNFVNGNLAITYGPGMLPFIGIIFFIICATLYPLFKGYLKFSQRKKQRIQYFLLGVFIFYLGNIIFNITLPLVFGVVRFYWIGDYSAIFLLGFTSYAIVKRELFGIEIILTTLLVALITLILTLDLFVFTYSLPVQIFKAVGLIIFLYFGYLLIKSVFQEIERREQIEKISKAKSEFISIASHQLRTPLTAMKGYLSMILEGSYGDLSEKNIRPMQNVYQSNERLIKLINDLLSVSRIEAGRIKVELKDTSLEDLISEVVDELKNEAQKKKLYLKWEKPKKPLPKVLLDKDKIRDVVLNLIDNAIKYTNEGGVTIKIQYLKSKIQILITDTGEGMAKEELSKVFKSFSRGEAGSKLWTEGAGLGLYIARKFIEMHKGKIWAESEGKQKGSQFYIELPLK